jgi:hypothetical protein
MSEALVDRPRRRDSDNIIGQLKTLWPVLLILATSYAAWERVRIKTNDNTDGLAKVVGEVDILKQTAAVQTAMLARIEDTVKEIARSQRRRRDD